MSYSGQDKDSGLCRNPVPVSKNNIDVLLVQPPVRDFYLTVKRTIPYGLLSIASSLVKEGYSVRLLDALATRKTHAEKTPPEYACLEPFYGRHDISPFCLFHQFRHYGYHPEHIAAIAAKSKPFLVGISSLFTPYEKEALDTARIVKKVLPESVVVLGGHHPTIFYENVMLCKAVDFVIRGEGEKALPELLKRLKLKKDPASIPGIVFRKKDGTCFVNPPAVIQQPDQFQIPAHHLVKWSYYQRKKKGSMTVVSSRGCPMKCSYCCIADSFVPYRKRRVQSVLEEIDLAVKEHHVRFVDFEDENISLDRKWFERLLEAIIERFGSYGLELRAMNGLYPPSLDETVLKLMKSAGFKTLNLSVGSISPRQQRRFNRPDMTECLERLLAAAQKHQLETVCYLIAAAPGQSAEDSLSDMLYVAQKPSLIGLSVFYPAPGSKDFSDLKKRGLLPKEFSLWRSSAFPVADSTTRVEAVTLLRLSRIINFMKFLTKKGETMPLFRDDEKQRAPVNTTNRTMVGRQLLSRFLADGIIRGMTSGGQIYEHHVSTALTKRFIEEIRHKRIQ